MHVSYKAVTHLQQCSLAHADVKLSNIIDITLSSSVSCAFKKNVSESIFVKKSTFVSLENFSLLDAAIYTIVRR